MTFDLSINLIYNNIDRYVYMFMERTAMSNEITLAYLAGAMDGDGSFSIEKIKRKTGFQFNYHPVLQCCKWHKSLAEMLKSEFGGGITEYHSKNKTIYAWRLRSKCNVIPVLEKLIPYLTVKKKRAQFLYNFFNDCEYIRGKSLSNDELIEKENAYLKMRKLNEWTSANTYLITQPAKETTKEPIFWAYIAGLIDTDGSFSIKKQKAQSDQKNDRYLPVISWSATDTSAMNFLRNKCNIGTIYVPKSKTCSRGFHYQFGIYTHSKCIEFIEHILPFLRLKKDNAETLLHFCKNISKTKLCSQGISSNELVFRENCHIRLIELNKDGVSKFSLMDLKPVTDNADGNKGQADNIVQPERSKRENSSKDEMRCSELRSKDGELG